MKVKIFICFALLVLALPSAVSYAQTSCGTITGPTHFFNPIPPIETRPIDDCENPFGRNQEGFGRYELVIDGAAVAEGSKVVIAPGGTLDYNVTRSSLAYFYRHDGQNYVFTDTSLSTPTEEEYRTFAESYLPGDVDKEIFIQAALSNDLSPLTEEEEEMYWDFMQYVDEQFVPVRPPLRAGTYTIVIEEPILVLNGGWLEWLKHKLVPVAYAQEYPVSPVYTFTFEVVEEEPEPVGASSVLFLPGIMGSRLYEDGGECVIGSGEQERWFSRSDCDQLRLAMDEEGKSFNDIYTKDGQPAVIDEAYIFNLYKTFFAELKDWKEEEAIADYAAVAYDWRLRLDEILQSTLDETTGEIRLRENSTYQDGYIYQTLKSLVEDSLNDRVTIVAHSNGGLVAKQLLQKMQENNDPLLDKIDNLILVGVPQTGTPDALIGILHGTAVGPGGFVVSQEMARRLMNDMPFAYHLLPSDSYFNGNSANVDTPVISFESGVVTTPMAERFGSSVTDSAAMYAFLGSDSNRDKPAVDDLVTPEIGNELLIDYAKDMDELQSEWSPPDSLQVYQIAGTGIDTPAGVTYFTDQECISRSILQLFRCTAYAPKLGYRINGVLDGDQTVVVSSALAMGESSRTKRIWMDFDSHNRDLSVRRHKDFLEVDDVINFISDKISSVDSTYTYLSVDEPELENEDGDRLIFQLHSPLDMWVRDEEGREISSSTVSIDGGVYQRFGELQYISLPHTNTANSLLLIGLAEGSFTLEVESFDSGDLEERHTYQGIPTSTSTKAELKFTDTDSIEEAILAIDYDSNGTVDISYDEQGVVEQVVTHQTLFSAIKALKMKTIQKRSLLVMVKLAEKYHKQSKKKPLLKLLEKCALLTLKRDILVYNRKGVISNTDSVATIKIIAELLQRI